MKIIKHGQITEKQGAFYITGFEIDGEGDTIDVGLLLDLFSEYLDEQKNRVKEMRKEIESDDS